MTTSFHAPNDTPATLPRPELRRMSWQREFLGSVLFIIIALIFSELTFPRSSIDGPSMEPTLFRGQNLLITRLPYLFGDPQRNDILVFDSPTDNAMLIKRVIGVPGDVIEMREQRVYLNGVLLDEPYFVNTPCTPRMCGDETTILGTDEYFMMGDNRNRSNDSRAFGAIGRERIVGKAIFRYFPLDKIGGLE